MKLLSQRDAGLKVQTLYQMASHNEVYQFTLPPPKRFVSLATALPCQLPLTDGPSSLTFFLWRAGQGSSAALFPPLCFFTFPLEPVA